MSQVRDGWSTTSTGGADQGTVRRANLSLVLRSLREGGARSRARLAADLGLNKATVSSLVTELRERGLVREGNAERGAVGRPGTIVEIDGAGAYGLGAEINVHHVSTRAVDLAGAVVSERRTEVDNEANLAAVAEAIPGDPERRDILVIHGEVGIGGGIVADGRPFAGRRGYAGEFGHMVVDRDGNRCGCGRTGCWETVIGLSHLIELAAAGEDDLLRSPLIDLEGKVEEITRRAAAGDERTLAALGEVGRWVGIGAAILTNVLNPGMIVLSGYLGEIGERIRAEVESELAAGVLAPDAGGTRIALSSLGFSAAVHGAAAVAIDHVYDDPTLVPRAVPTLEVMS